MMVRNKNPEVICRPTAIASREGLHPKSEARGVGGWEGCHGTDGGEFRRRECTRHAYTTLEPRCTKKNSKSTSQAKREARLGKSALYRKRKSGIKSSHWRPPAPIWEREEKGARVCDRSITAEKGKNGWASLLPAPSPLPFRNGRSKHKKKKTKGSMHWLGR
jgi:hypothetical protein